MLDRTLHIFLIIWLLTYSMTVCAVEFIMPESSHSIEKRDLTRFINADSLINIDTKHGESFAIFSQYMAAEKRGIVILIPDVGHSPLSYSGFNYLHKALTNDGFDTYAIQIPDFKFDDSDTNTDTTATADVKQDVKKRTKIIEAFPEVSLNNYKIQLVDIFNGLYSQLTMRQQEQLVVIAQGTSAGVFSEYLADLPNIKLDAFVAISAQLPNSSRHRHLPANLSLISQPLLDIFYDNDNPKVTRNMPERIRWVKRNSKFDYRQRQLFGLTTEPRQHQRLRKEVDGFLRQL